MEDISEPIHKKKGSNYAWICSQEKMVWATNRKNAKNTAYNKLSGTKCERVKWWHDAKQTLGTKLKDTAKIPTIVGTGEYKFKWNCAKRVIIKAPTREDALNKVDLTSTQIKCHTIPMYTPTR